MLQQNVVTCFFKVVCIHLKCSDHHFFIFAHLTSIYMHIKDYETGKIS